jgi:hypothetical protein
VFPDEDTFLTVWGIANLTACYHMPGIRTSVRVREERFRVCSSVINAREDRVLRFGFDIHDVGRVVGNSLHDGNCAAGVRILMCVQT